MLFSYPLFYLFIPENVLLAFNFLKIGQKIFQEYLEIFRRKVLFCYMFQCILFLCERFLSMLLVHLNTQRDSGIGIQVITVFRINSMMPWYKKRSLFIGLKLDFYLKHFYSLSFSPPLSFSLNGGVITVPFVQQLSFVA